MQVHTSELKIVKVCTEPVQVQVKQNPSMGHGHEITHLAVELLASGSCKVKDTMVLLVYHLIDRSCFYIPMIIWEPLI